MMLHVGNENSACDANSEFTSNVTQKDKANRNFMLIFVIASPGRVQQIALFIRTMDFLKPLIVEMWCLFHPRPWSTGRENNKKSTRISNY